MSRKAFRLGGLGSRVVLMRTIALFALLALLAPSVVEAQRAVPEAVVAQPGATVRVWTPGWRYTGTLGLRGADTAVIRFATDSALVAISAIQRLDVQQGTRHSVGRILAGTGIGVVLGTVVGAFAGVGLECGMSCENDGEWAGLTGAAFGAATGAVVGAIAGGMIGGRKRYPRWIPAVLP